jgi:hypothetical protein
VKRVGLALGVTAMLALSTLAQSCASVLGVDETFDAVAAMCQCNEQLKFLGKRAACEALISQRVDGASEETRQEWLEYFAKRECDECANVLDCYYRTPACSTGACTDSEECCGNRDGTGYCLLGECRRQAPGCKTTNQPCQTPDDCCGSEAGLADCFFGNCVENCAVDGAANCPDCCMHADVKVPGSTSEQRAICLKRDDEFCELLCNPNGDPCLVGSESCQPTCNINDPEQNLCAYVCAP